jgi:hypothetical protein
MKRNEKEKELWKQFEYDKEIKEKETIIKRTLKQCHVKVYEGHQEIVDCECDEQAIEYHSNLNMSCSAV